MSASSLDSRMSLGTDLERRYSAPGPYAREMSSSSIYYAPSMIIRVIVGRLGSVVRMSAPVLDIVVDAINREDAWAKFLGVVRERDDFAWFRFDVGPTREEEIAMGLNAPEDEEWPDLLFDDGE